jgi:hypothetical protein
MQNLTTQIQILLADANKRAYLAEQKAASLLDAFICLREAIEEEGYDVYVGNEHKPLYTQEEIYDELIKHFNRLSGP